MSTKTDLPRVTILTPTSRPYFLRQCAKYVARQTYPLPLLEWVIIDSSCHDEFEMPEAKGLSRIAVLHQKGAVGLLRNQGLRVAVGDLVVHFDDDDWHAPDRIERQVRAFLARPSLKLCATEDYHVGLFDEKPVRAMKSWSWGLETFSSGGSFMYRRSAWREHAFPNLQMGEDQLFARWLRMHNASSAQNLRDPGLFVCVRHGQNTCDFQAGEHATVEHAEWLRSLMGTSDYEATETLVRMHQKPADELRQGVENGAEGWDE